MQKPTRPVYAAGREGWADLLARDVLNIKSREFPRSVNLNPQAVDVVLFDVHSIDSFAACCVARMALGGGAKYEAVTRSGFIGQLHTNVHDRTVAMLGVSWKVDCMHDLAWNCDTLLMMETQSSVEIELAEYMQTYHTIFFIDSMMGAGVMAWNFFYPGEPAPVMLRALEDVHLGRYALRDARDFEDGVGVVLDYSMRSGPLHQNNQAFNDFISLLQDNHVARRAICQAIEEGKVVRQCVQTMCEQVVQRMRVLSLRAFPSLLCALAEDASPFQGRLAEYLAGEFAERLGVNAAKRCFAAVFQVRASQVRVVLRSKRGGADVSHIAQFFDGAGNQDRGFFTLGVEAWEAIWTEPETVLWDVTSHARNCLELAKGDLVTIIRRDQRFRESPFDLWSWGYKTLEPEMEGWIPTLAHTVFFVIQSLPSPGLGVQDLKEGQLVIGTGQVGNFLYGWILGLATSKHWFPMSEDNLRPVKPSSAARLVQEHDERSHR